MRIMNENNIPESAEQLFARWKELTAFGKTDEERESVFEERMEIEDKLRNDHGYLIGVDGFREWRLSPVRPVDEALLNGEF